MQTTRHRISLSYTREELHALFALASAEDVEKGGRYDARGGAVNFWTHGWMHPATREESETMGTVYVNWVSERIWQIECAEGFALDDLLLELGALELKALGRVKHGKM